MKNVQLPGRYGDGVGLYLNVAPGGSKSWVQRLLFDGRRRDLGLGGYPTVSLAEARDRAIANKRVARDGGNPLSAKTTRRAEKKAAPAPGIPTFRDAAATVHTLNSTRWGSAKTQNNWWQRAERYVFPIIGDIPVDQIGRTEVLGILTPIWAHKPETARRVRLIIKTVMSWSMSYGYVTFNPAGEMVDAALPAMPKVGEHYKALPFNEAAAAIATVAGSTSFPASKLAFKFVVLTASRSGETRRATWNEVDLKNARWVIPQWRMKKRHEHRVPLSTGAIAVLQEALALPTNGSPYLFPNDLKPSNSISDNGLSSMLRRLGIPSTVHGFRSSFRDWAAECTDASYAAMELSLAHQVGSATVRAYVRSDLFQQRRTLMQRWSDYLG